MDHYVPHMGWIAGSISTIKIYSKYRGVFYYLHDEVHDKLFEFATKVGGRINSKEDYNAVIRAYLATYPENAL
ncbi:hypothetical protein [Dyadobacter sandarakinus]|uniref:Uncharacterized protein n=1 Tax=Dyadobacter sandarakinus TaxID=2747268 RepID=A0ABX7I1J2_9BACT|nr:hypothetical protein [Dyadobacter sandarakinus]QRQ99737.1 hypothetical protein HWI92_01795 [Dyadobacter sandarakinus]